MADSANARASRAIWPPRAANRALLAAAVSAIAVPSLCVGWLPTVMVAIPALAVLLLVCAVAAALSRRLQPLGAGRWLVAAARVSAAVVLTLVATFALERGRITLDKWHAEKLALRLHAGRQTVAPPAPIDDPWWFRGRVHAEVGSGRFTIELPDRTSLTDVWVYDNLTRRWREK